ncbi:RING/U-box [Atractiella rhizophila]|nr:RING/U-box [Atractiella rhizophila]
MKVKIKAYHPIAVWSWNLKQNQPLNAQATGNEAEDGDDEEEDVCGICRIAFDGCCSDCKVPGDDCPLIWGECTHVFHMHCLLKWLNSPNSKNQCPMDRRPWSTSSFP